ncbi:MAG: hypothetical protein KDC53_16310 [Saprospiraceae bacterium]|nr:hypothetical protein [Saprospiraceae bacterium]
MNNLPKYRPKIAKKCTLSGFGKLTAGIVILSLLGSCQYSSNNNLDLDIIAEKYVKTALRIGQYDKDFIDAYYGPEEWKPNRKESDTLPLTLVSEVQSLIDQINELPIPNSTLDIARLYTLRKQIIAMQTKLLMLAGKHYDFDDEALLLYDISPPHFDFSYFDTLLNRLDRFVPGQGALSDKYENFTRKFIIPKERLDTVFKTAIQEARRRTKLHFDLPADESFTLEYVTGKSWSGYNYYQGNSHSLIQINTDFPIYIERALDLACHEGYPGHHVYNSLLEQNLVTDKGWVEFSLYPLFSPQSFIAEGSANYGIKLAFPRDEKIRFEKEVLYPLANLDTSLAEKYAEVQKLRSKLNYAGNEIARLYLNGTWTRDEAASALEKYLLYEPERAMQRVQFIKQYRTYVINYNVGEDVIANYIRQEAGMDYSKRWDVFGHLLSNPMTASMISKE